MQNDLTPNLGLPLPHPENELAEDVIRIRDAFTVLDQKIGAVNALVASQLAAQNTAINAQLTAQNDAVAQRLAALSALVYAGL